MTIARNSLAEIRLVSTSLMDGLSLGAVSPDAVAYNNKAGGDLGWSKKVWVSRAGSPTLLVNDLGTNEKKSTDEKYWASHLETALSARFAEGVAAFQASKGMAADGKLGPATWTALKGGTTAKPTTSSGSTTSTSTTTSSNQTQAEVETPWYQNKYLLVGGAGLLVAALVIGKPKSGGGMAGLGGVRKMKDVLYLIRRHGSNAANQSMTQVMPVAIVVAKNLSHAIWIAEQNVVVYSNQYLTAVPASKAKRTEIEEVERREATDRAYGLGSLGVTANGWYSKTHFLKPNPAHEAWERYTEARITYENYATMEALTNEDRREKAKAYDRMIQAHKAMKNAEARQAAKARKSSIGSCGCAGRG